MTNFNIDDYIINTDSTNAAIAVQLPYSSSFMVNPATLGNKIYLHVAYYKKRWWLVEPDIAQTCFIPKMYRASFVEAMYDNGTTILIPVTVPTTEESREWNLSLKKALKAATTKWIKLKSDHDSGLFTFSEARNVCCEEPEWNYELKDLLSRAFNKRHIATESQVTKMFSQHYEVIEED
jgi:hypothetical protein